MAETALSAVKEKKTQKNLGDRSNRWFKPI